MRFLALLLALSVGFVAAGCGGGGGGASGGGSIAVTGAVSDVVIGVPNPAALVSAPGATSTSTSTTDGSFSINVPSGTTQMNVAWEGATPPVIFTFTFPPITAAGSVGTLWIGPLKVTATGTVVDSTTLDPIGGATVTLGGVSGTTTSSGTFSIPGVAYAASSSFPSLPGTISATGYISTNFQPGSATVTNDTVSVGAIGLTPSNGNPPGTPYDLWGRVSPLKDSPGATVTLSQNGSPVRQTTVGSAGTYYFWVPAGTYTITVTQTGYTAQPVTATLASTNQVLEEDVTLSP